MKAGAEKKVPRRERERLRHAEEILDAAEEVFARDGYHGASIQKIAREAEFSVGKIYQHFQSKDELYDAVMSSRVVETFDLIRKAVAAAPDPPTKVRAALAAQFGYMEKHRAFLRLFMNDTMGFRARMKASLGEELYAKYEAYLGILVDAFAEGVRTGHFPEADPVDLMLAYSGIAFSFVTYFEEKSPGASLIELIPRIEAMFYGRIWK